MVGLQQRVASEIKTTFSSHYVAEISLAQALTAEAIAVYGQRQSWTEIPYLSAALEPSATIAGAP